MARIFKIGTTKIVEDETIAELSLDEVREHLKMVYPEVAEATIRERTEGETTFIEFLPRPGRKG